MTDNLIVWTEVPAADMDRAVRFYSQAFGWDLKVDDSGPNPVAMFPGADGPGSGGHLYPGRPGAGTGPTPHFAVPALEAAADRVREAGGSVDSDPISIPPGRFVYATDSEGNSIGLFEPKG